MVAPDHDQGGVEAPGPLEAGDKPAEMVIDFGDQAVVRSTDRYGRGAVIGGWGRSQFTCSNDRA